MKKIFALVLGLMLSTPFFAQIKFEKGYFIKNDGEQVSCYIENLDWKDSPLEFNYKINPDAPLQKASLEDLQEFQITNHAKYIKRTVDLDMSSDNMNNLTYVRKPLFEKKTIVLKVLLEGEISLYKYEKNLMLRFFTSQNNGELKQLINKSYISKEVIRKNNRYRVQLQEMLDPKYYELSELKTLKYRTSDLTKFITNYSKQKGNVATSYSNKEKKDLFHLNLRPGIIYAGLNLSNTSEGFETINFEPKVSFRLGLETEFILPTNGNKWSVILEPNLYYFKSEGESDNSADFLIDLKQLDIPVGFRYYSYLKNSNKLFFNALVNYGFSIGSSLKYSTGKEIDLGSRPNLLLGVGYQADQYGVELRAQTPRDLTGSSGFWTADQNMVNLIFIYKI